MSTALGFGNNPTFQSANAALSAVHFVSSAYCLKTDSPIGDLQEFPKIS